MTAIIDAHTHIFDEITYASYRAKARGVEKIITIHFWTNEGEPKHSLESLVELASSKDELFVMGAVNVLHDMSIQLHKLEELLKREKLIGIKMYTGYQHFYPSDDIVLPVAKLCEKYNKPLMFHSGDMSPRGTPLLKYAQPIHVDDLACKFPELKIIIAHFGFPYFLEAATVANKNKNVFLDLSGTLVKNETDEENRAQQKAYTEDLKRALAYFPAVKNKVLFGTDYGGEHSHLDQVEPYVELVRDVFHDEHTRTQVFSGLASELFFS